MIPDKAKLCYPWAEPPEPGKAIEVADGVLWFRLPLPMTLDHVNIYALDEGDSWTIVDTGMRTRAAKEIWETLLAGPLMGRPVARIILTHYHPDHVGMVGWLMDRFGAELLTSRISWLMARMLILDVENEVTEQAKQFWIRAGMPDEVLQQRLSTRPFNFSDVACRLPVGFTRVRHGDTLTAAGRTWDVHFGHGHAEEHLTLWSQNDHLVLAGDQILPSISPNIGVYPAEPEADPLAEWLESCERLKKLATSEQLVLGGHKLPFTGLPFRMDQLIENHHSALRRLVEHLATPRTAVDCFAPLFKRKIDDNTYGMALVEAVAHLNHLLKIGRITRTRREDGAWLWLAGE